MSHSSHTVPNSIYFVAKKRVKRQSQIAGGTRGVPTTSGVVSFCILASLLAIAGASTFGIPARVRSAGSKPVNNEAPTRAFQERRSAPNPSGNVTPEGRFDILYDKDGRKYSLRDLKVDTALRFPDRSIRTSSTCNTGYFQLYFEVNSGLAGTSTTDIARRNVLCQVFSDIATFLPTPPGTPLANGTHKVNIWVRDIGQIISNPQNSGLLGLATAFYSVPAGSTATGIVDSQVWRTINSGTDAYTAVAAPILVQGGQYNSGSGSYYHGMVALNFSNSGINWNTNTSIAAPTGLYDLYTIALHEITHALGFASLIDFNGNSKFGSAQYYGRYDLFLQTQAGIKLLTNAGGCSLYNFGWNTSLTASSTLSPNAGTCGGVIPFNGGNDNTNCATALEYFSSNLATHQKVYTYDCFTGASSLSHFEDACAPTNLGNNSYFVMSNANGAGVTKRYLQQEESRVLCDLGYEVTNSYGSTAVWDSSHSYTGGPCSRMGIAGVNDGINTSGAYTYTGIASSTIPITGFLANDYITPGNTIAFECLEDLYFGGTLSATSGSSSTTVNYTPPAAAQGATVLRYIPVNTTTGKRGNMTYIYVYVTSPNCTAGACNMINNGGFENNLNCGQMGNDTPPPSISCWSIFSCTPDLYKRSCVNPNVPDITVPTSRCTPPADTWNNGQNGNNTFIGLWSMTNFFTEGLQTGLNSAMTPGQSYLLSFWARVTNTFGMNLASTLEIGGGPTIMAPIGGGYYTAMPSAFSSLGSVVVPNNNQWNYVTIQLTNNNSSSINVLSFVNAAYLNPSSYGNHNTMILIDDVSLSPVNSAPTLSLPSSLCPTGIIPDLSQYATPANGVFSGPGVSVSSGIYSFNAATAGLGTHTIIYTGTTGNGCPYTVAANVAVVNSGVDLYMKDTMAPDMPEDFGVEPSVSQLLYISRDIWVRTSQDATITSANPGLDSMLLADSYYANEHQHQNPTYNGTTPSYVYAKVRNRGCASSSGTEKLRIYWANASTGLPWPGGTGVWNELDCVAGGLVDPCPLPVIGPGEDYVVELPWLTPDPASFGGVDHFCLVARIETQPSFPFGMTSPEGSLLWQNVAGNNKIAWKNITVFAGSGHSPVIVRNTFERATTLTLHFAVPATELKDHFLLHGDIFVDLGDALMRKWRHGGQRPQGFEVVGKTTIKIREPVAVLAGLLFAPGETQTIEVRMQLKQGDKARVGRQFNWDVIQMAPLRENANPSAVGGERYIFTVPEKR
jgi:hypothetical protein